MEGDLTRCTPVLGVFDVPIPAGSSACSLIRIKAAATLPAMFVSAANQPACCKSSSLVQDSATDPVAEWR